MIIVGLDSYNTLDALIAYAIEHGHSDLLAEHDDAQLEGFSREATIFLDNGWAWKGRRTDPAQALQWPRTGVVVDGIRIDPDAVPKPIRTAQILLTIERRHGPLQGSTGGTGRSGRVITSEHAEDAAVRYADDSASRRFPLVGALVSSLAVSRRLGFFRQIHAARS